MSTKYPLSEDETHYINTDLDITCKTDASALAKFLEAKRWSVHHADWHPDGYWLGVFEHPLGHQQSPEHAIRLMLNLLEKLPDEIQSLWKRCRKREFNIGYQTGYGPRAFEQGVSNPLLLRVAAIGASIGVTIYEPADAPPPAWLTKE